MKCKLIIVACVLLAALVVGCVQQEQATPQGVPTATESSAVKTPTPIPTSPPSSAIKEMVEPMPASRTAQAAGLSLWMPYSTHYVRAGGSNTFTVMVRNNAEQQRTLDVVPVMYEQGSYESSVDPDWVSVLPSRLTLAAGESAELSITVSPPNATSTGWYRGMLALRSTSFPEQLRYYSIYVYKPLSEPITKEFNVPSGTSGLLVVVSWQEHEGVNAHIGAVLISPNGTRVSGTETKRMYGWIDGGSMRAESTSISHTTRIYVKSPQAGTWTLEMKPDVAASLSFTITLNPRSSEVKE
ncbi:MAG: COG1470 family protein [Methermicoccaceae archaeon]